ncbi:MAG: DUF1553 domain-containing protein [Planctomycetota bacterium]|nr:DUF1553 domain-containing protein [Planctomycetota bacterium]
MHRPRQIPARLFLLALVSFCPALVPIFPGPFGEALASQQGNSSEIDFNRDIRPILSDRCFKCHGPDENSRQSDLRLDQREAALSVLEGKPPETSEFWRRITADDPEERMPPASSKLSLSSAEKKKLKAWLSGGARYEVHWSFAPPRKPILPKVQKREWPKNEIDHFILSRLEAQGLTPAEPSARERLIRRVSFDLTGLPPTVDEIREFVNDRAPDAYEKVVDRLLKQEAYGERMTSEWLDVARYSDSFGYQVDRGRHVWPWRDWVIRSFNQNKSYDQFVVEQLAGDMLPAATDDQVLATAFNRLHPQKVEGGSVPEEFRVEYVADRTHTFATAFLGLTLECARCHDHKYDPLTQTEYYQLFAYFNNIDEAGLYSYFTSSTPTPTLMLSSSEQKKRLAELEERMGRLEEQVRSFKPEDGKFQQWLENPENELWTLPIEHNTLDDFKGGGNKPVPGKIGKGVQLTGDDAIGLKSGNFSRNQAFSISIWLNTPDHKKRAVVLHRSRAWTDAASRGYQLLIEDGKLSVSLIHFWPGNAIRVRTRNAIPIQKWIQASFSYDGSSRADGLKIYLDGQPVETEIVRDNLYKNITGGGGNQIAIGQRFRDKGFKQGKVDDVKVFDRELTPFEFRLLNDNRLATSLQQAERKSLSVEMRQLLRTVYKRHHSPGMKELQKQLREVRDQRSKAVDGTVEIMVMNDMKPRRTTYRLQRGAYDQPREKVALGIPAALQVDSRPGSRLELARWVVSPSNPLTARVTVNRYWQLIFGDGLVRTPEDFGSQGQPPTHPDLLDWLATDFVAHHWNLKRLIRQMVLSATYRQDSKVDRKLYELDPENRLLARASSFRLQAEMLRDNALFASGTLVRKIGGGGAKPYDLALSFKPMGADNGEGLYRRSVYTYWKRTGPSPVMMTLDASKRDVCTVKREKTATPLQSFVLMNDPQFVEAARMLAARTLTEKPDAKQRIAFIFQKLCSRPAQPAELEILFRLFQSQKKYFQQNKQQVEPYLSVGKKRIDRQLDSLEVAALATVTQTIMNFDECVMRR